MQACHPDFTLFSTDRGCLAQKTYVIFILLLHDWFAEFTAKTMGKECVQVWLIDIRREKEGRYYWKERADWKEGNLWTIFVECLRIFVNFV